jgi:hypothetical protein
MKKRLQKIIFFFLFVLYSFAHAQTPRDSTNTPNPVVDTVATPQLGNKNTEVVKDEESILSIHFLKEKVYHSPDSTFFNVLKITNTNGKPIQGVVKLSAPIGWNIISAKEVNVNIAPGASELIPLRVAISRYVVGGVSYLINATLQSDRSLYAKKNQTYVSKSCYIIIPEMRQWDMYPVSRSVYIDKYTQSAPLKVRLVNKGNGNEVVKLEFDIGTSLLMYGTLTHKHFTSVELKPHTDTVVDYLIKYTPPNESAIWDRDFKKLTVKILAVVDTIVKSSSVNYKFLESSYHNRLPANASPLNIEVQLQNLVSSAEPRLLVAANGMIIRKNNDVIDYNFRINSLAFSGYHGADDFGSRTWRRSRMVAGYTSGDKWQVRIGDVNSNAVGLISNFGRGASGWYRIDEKNRVGASLTANIFSPIYSGSLFHETKLPQNISLSSSIVAILDNYNKMNTYGAGAMVNYPFLPGHNIALTLTGSLTQHNYDDKTFVAPNGNFLITHDPNTSRMGFATQLNYRLTKKKVSASANLIYATRDFFQYLSGKINLITTAHYTINDRYFLIGNSTLILQDPKRYVQGVLFPTNKFLSGSHRVELAKIVSNKLTLYLGPMIDHIYYKALKINKQLGDSTYAEFASINPKLSFRCNYKNNVSGFISPYVNIGYTFITHAVDSFIAKPNEAPRKEFLNAKAGVNIMQGNWGVNVFYYFGPNSLVSQSDNYYYGRYSKSLRIMPFFQKYYWNKKMLFTTYDSYFYEALSNNERITANARFTFFFDKGWNAFVDNNLYLSSVINAENQKVYTRSFFLNVGIRKAFDIQQPGIKYHDIKIICFKDINGNKTMDANEHGLRDIVIGIDKQVVLDSISKKMVKQMGQFSPAEIITDDFGQVIYNRIPQGAYDVSVFPLLNLVDLYNINGQKQSLFISRDTTYYIPFVQSYRVLGKIILNRDEYSSLGGVSPAGVRITATDSIGNSYFGLTTANGTYTLFVPAAGKYTVSVNHVFGDQFVLQQSEYVVSFDGAKEFNVDFIFDEKKRQINFSGSLPVVNDATAPSPVTNTTPEQPVSIPTTSPATMVYKVQIASKNIKIPATQYANLFKGIENVSEYVADGKYKYTSGNFSDMAKAKEHQQKLISMGYQGAFVVDFQDGKRIK